MIRYEKIEIGDVFIARGNELTVVSKNDKYRFIVTINYEEILTVWSEDELYMLKPRKEELPEEGLLISKGGSLVYRLSDRAGYGFVWGRQSNYAFNDCWDFSIDGHWKPATEEQEKKFVEMLKIECEKHGLFKNTKIEAHADGTSLIDPDFTGVTPRFSLTTGYNRNGQIFNRGRFATPRKETTLELVSKASIDLSKFGVEIKQDGNLLVINPIKK